MDVIQKQKAVFASGVCPVCRQRRRKTPTSHFAKGDAHRRWFAVYHRFVFQHLRGAVPRHFLHRYEVQNGLRTLKRDVYKRMSSNPWD
jgi:hypothetical protein